MIGWIRKQLHYIKIGRRAEKVRIANERRWGKTQAYAYGAELRERPFRVEVGFNEAEIELINGYINRENNPVGRNQIDQEYLVREAALIFVRNENRLRERYEKAKGA